MRENSIIQTLEMNLHWRDQNDYMIIRLLLNNKGMGYINIRFKCAFTSSLDCVLLCIHLDFNLTRA